MISANTQKAIELLPFKETCLFIKGFLRGNPSKQNPYWVKIKKIIDARINEFESEFNTKDFNEILKIIYNLPNL